MKQIFSILFYFILITSELSAALYDGLTTTLIEDQGVEILLKTDSDDPLMKIVQALVLGRMTEEGVVYDPDKDGLLYVVKEKSAEAVLLKASKTLYEFTKMPATFSELHEVKALLRDYSTLADKLDLIEIVDIHKWFYNIQNKTEIRGKSNSGFQFSVVKEDQEKISGLIYALSHYNYWQLLWKQSEINAIGDSVRHVPPLQFLVVCCGSAKLKSWMQNIRKSTLKWNSFISALSDRIAHERNSGRLCLELPGFAAALKKKEQLRSLQEYAANGNWGAFVEVLLK
jgi:hypothetical protein